MKRIDWGSFSHLLGQITDRELGEMMGISAPTVAAKRRETGIKPCRAHKRVIKDWYALIGTMTDCSLSKKVGVSHQRIFQIRQRLGIPAYKNIMDVDEIKKLCYLGYTDQQVSEKLNMSIYTIRKTRKANGIQRNAPKTTREICLEHIEELGIISDGNFAKKYNLYQQKVCEIRNSLGIAPFQTRRENIDLSLAEEVFLEAEKKGYGNKWIAQQIDCDPKYVNSLKKRIDAVKYLDSSRKMINSVRRK